MDSASPLAAPHTRRSETPRSRNEARLARADVARVAVVGAGTFGRLRARKYARLGGCRLCAIVDPVVERARARGEAFGVPAYPHHAQLVGRVDLASVVTPAATHHAPAGDALLMQLASFLRCARLRRRPEVDGHRGFDAFDVALRIRDAVTATAAEGS